MEVTEGKEWVGEKAGERKRVRGSEACSPGEGKKALRSRGKGRRRATTRKEKRGACDAPLILKGNDGEEGEQVSWIPARLPWLKLGDS